MSKPLKYSLFLITLGVLAGFLLAIINSITAPIISERKKLQVKEDLQAYFTYNEYSENQITNYKDADDAITAIYYAFGTDGKLAAVIYQTSYKGYKDTVVSLIAIKTDGTFDDARLSDHKETAGIGSLVETHNFNVSGEKVDDYSYSILAGSTYTSNAVTRGIDTAAKHFKTIQSTLGGITNE